VAEAKSLDFEIFIDPDLPQTFRSDERRVQQVLKNLLSNAFKFTERGKVKLQMVAASDGWSDQHLALNQAKTVVAFTVSDTGIGIAKEKQQLIFEAFQQADSGTARKYGGTGLGLSISREIARMLGGTIRVESAPGLGSTFTFFLPLNFVAPAQATSPTGHTLAAIPLFPGPRVLPPQCVSEADEAAALNDDRASIQPGDPLLLIVEDDLDFARILLDLAREKSFKALVTARAEKGLLLAREHKPSAILLDLRLPDGTGWSVFDRLKHDRATRHIPVDIISVEEDDRRGLRLGAMAYLKKPVAREDLVKTLDDAMEFTRRNTRNLLLLTRDACQCQDLPELLGSGDLQITLAASAHEASDATATTRFDCVVLDLNLPSGLKLLHELRPHAYQRYLPVVLYAERKVTPKEAAQLKRIPAGVVVHEATSREQLLDLTALFLHREVLRLSASGRQILDRTHTSDALLAGKKVLIVDDDIRNIFALTTVMERYSMQVLSAENGRDGIELLNQHKDIDVILMDIMMPGMDGYDTIAAIRQRDLFKDLPMLALTAKAMKGDREKCLKAGATDYLAKPVNTEQLLSLLRVWLYKP
jgi:CheY-like chemotaxis protein